MIMTASSCSSVFTCLPRVCLNTRAPPRLAGDRFTGVRGDTLPADRPQRATVIGLQEQLDKLNQAAGRSILEDLDTFQEGEMMLVVFAVSTEEERPVHAFQSSEGYQFVFSPPAEGDQGKLLAYRIPEKGASVGISTRVGR